jgi:hypothetical protein
MTAAVPRHDAQGHRLLEQHVLTRLQRADRHGLVQEVGHGNDHGVDAVVLEQVLDARGRAGGRKATGQLRRAVGIHVADRHRVDPGRLEPAGVQLRDRPRPDDPDPCRHALTPSRRRPAPVRCASVAERRARGNRDDRGAGRTAL